MRIIHTSDWHLGRIIFGRSMLDDQRSFVNDFFLPLCEKEKPDAVILAGDIFDRQFAPVEAVRLFDEFLSHLCIDMNIPLVALAGNHDAADRIAVGGALLRKAGATITTKLDPFQAPLSIGNVDIYSFPYIEPALMQEVMKDESLRSFSDGYKAVLSSLREDLDKNKINILCGHCFVVGAVTSESESPSFVGGSGEVSSDVFAGFDYVALGHLHRPQTIANTRYSGSPIQYSFDEEKHNKSITILDINDRIDVREVPVVSKRNMRTVCGTIDEIRVLSETDENRDDYIRAILKGVPIFEPMQALRDCYSNTLTMCYEQNIGSGDGGRDELRRKLERQDDLSVFSEFLRQMCGEEMTEEDKQVFLEAQKGR